MKPAGTPALFLVFLLFLAPLYAETQPEPQPDDEEPPLTAGLFFFEELFIIEESLSFDEALMWDEMLLGEKPIEPEEPLLSEEIEEVEEAEEAFPDAEPLLAESTEETEETLSIDEFENMFLSAETPAEEEAPLDDASFFFEAPPLVFEVPTFETRSFGAIFPDFTRRQRMVATSSTGLRHSFMHDEPPAFVPHPSSGVDLLGSVMEKDPSHLVETLMLIPYREKEFDLLDIYNALGRVEALKNYPAVVNGNDLYIFTESTRIESARKRKAIPDPPPALTLPFAETMYVCLKEINFGNLFIRNDIGISMYGITYSMTNFTDVRYFLVPIIKAEKYLTIIYLEPVKEGLLVYSVTGFYLPGFISDRVNLTPNINRRIEILTNWILDGLKQ